MKLITGNTFEFNGAPHIIRSINFAENTATLEKVSKRFTYSNDRIEFNFVTVSIGKAHRAMLDLEEFKAVGERKVDFAKNRCGTKGKFKVSKQLIAKLESNYQAI